MYDSFEQIVIILISQKNRLGDGNICSSQMIMDIYYSSDRLSNTTMKLISVLLMQRNYDRINWLQIDSKKFDSSAVA